MAKRFEATATSLQDGLDYRVDIYDARYSGTDVETLEDERQFISIPVGEADDSGKRVFKPREIQLSLIQTADASVLTNAGPTDVRVEVVRTGTSDTIYKGYIFPNRFQDSPLGPQPDTLTLQGTEGLPSLQDTSFGDLAISSNDTVEIMTTIRTILNQTYPSDLPIEIGVEWWPSSGAGSAELTTSDLPLQFAELDPANYREDRDDDSSPWWSCYQVLEDILKEQGCTIQQTFSGGSLHWHIRQRSAFQEDGTIRLWTVQPGGATTHDGLVNIRSDLSTLDDTRIKFKPNREFSQQRKRVVVTHDHTEVENFLAEGGFENSGNDWIVSAPNISAFVGDHDNHPESPTGVAGDQGLGIMQYDSDTAPSLTNASIEYGFAQSFVPYIKPEKEAFMRLGWTGGHFWHTGENRGIFPFYRISFGSTYYTTTTSDVRGDTAERSEILPVDPVTAPIAKGASLPVLSGGFNRQYPFPRDVATTIDVKERVEVGDTEIVGTLNDSIDQGWKVLYITPTGSQDDIQLNEFTLVGTPFEWSRKAIYLPLQDSSGNRLTSNLFTLEMGILHVGYNIDYGIIAWKFDNVRFQPVQDGQVLYETVAEANDGSVGIDEETTHRLGSGPGTQNVARMYGQSRNGTSWNAFLWGDGPDTSDIYPISELHARQRLRHMSGQNQRLETTVLVEDGSPDLWGHELIRLSSLVLWNQLDGDADSKVGPDGTIQGDPQPVAGVNGGAGEALDFDGVDDLIDLGTPLFSTTDATQPYTISAWVKPSSVSNFIIISQYHSTSPTRFIFRITDDGSDVIEWFEGGDRIQGSTAISAGSYLHIVGVKNSSGDVSIYLNGTLDNSIAGADTTAFDDGSSEIGGLSETGLFADGAIDELRIYDRALSATEVGSLYHNPLSGRRDALGGKQYTISSIETRPTMGETQLNLLEHQDFGT